MLEICRYWYLKSVSVFGILKVGTAFGIGIEKYRGIGMVTFLFVQNLLTENTVCVVRHYRHYIGSLSYASDFLAISTA
jgi:hypothetical protein